MKGLPLIGRGSFSRVYRKGANEVLIVSTDKVKAAMSERFWPKSRLFPRIKFIGYNEDDTCTYSSRYYPKVKSLKLSLETAEWEFYKFLRDLDRYPEKNYRYEHYLKQFATIPWRSKRNAMLEAWECLRMYSDDACFEISPRNVAVHRGKLVLLDVFFFYHQL